MELIIKWQDETKGAWKQYGNILESQSIMIQLNGAHIR